MTNELYPIWDNDRFLVRRLPNPNDDGYPVMLYQMECKHCPYVSGRSADHEEQKRFGEVHQDRRHHGEATR